MRRAGHYPSSGDPNNTGSHGTHVSDIIAGNRREPGLVVGLAWVWTSRSFTRRAGAHPASLPTWAIQWAARRA
jgi:hypothetical protein